MGSRSQGCAGRCALMGLMKWWPLGESSVLQKARVPPIHQKVPLIPGPIVLRVQIQDLAIDSKDPWS